MSRYHKFFKAYDIRGTYPELNEEVYYWTGRGIVEKVLKPENLPLAFNLVHDTRYTSPQFYKALYNGLKDAGAEVITLGIASTDFLYASCLFNGNPGGIITASHNPKDDNGLKTLKYGSQMLGLDSGLDKVRDYVIYQIEKDGIDKNNWQEPETDKQTKEKIVHFLKSKLEEIAEVKKTDQTLALNTKPIKIAVDAGNGMGGWIMQNILTQIYGNIQFVPLYWELDGNFPNHPADPQNYNNLKDLQNLIQKDSDIVFGIAFDGDADRAFFVDEKGQVIDGDHLVAYFADTLISKHIQDSQDGDSQPAAVYIVPGSRCVPEAIMQAGGITIPSKQGHTYIKELMAKHQALYGGEFSGHHYFGKFGNLDSGVLAAALLIKIFAESKTTLSAMFNQLRSYYFVAELENLQIPEHKSFAKIVKELKSYYSEAKFCHLDGLTVFYPDWKFTMRASNTEPKVRFTLETRGRDFVKEKLEEVKKIFFA